MPTINDTTVLNIDGTPYAVESFSEQVQNLVQVYNTWNQKEVAAQGEVAILHAAKQTLSAQIIAKVNEEITAETETKAKIEAATTNVTIDETANVDIETITEETIISTE